MCLEAGILLPLMDWALPKAFSSIREWWVVLISFCVSVVWHIRLWDPFLQFVPMSSLEVHRLACVSFSSFGEITTKKIALTNAAGEVLVGTLDDTCSREIVILCHGFRSSKEFFGLINVSAALCGLGLSTFRFDFSGNGESQGE
eukprot:c23154_g1_i4 orf=71-502(+)